MNQRYSIAMGVVLNIGACLARRGGYANAPSVGGGMRHQVLSALIPGAICAPHAVKASQDSFCASIQRPMLKRQFARLGVEKNRLVCRTRNIDRGAL
jgi:hypothetical protein